MHPNPDTIEFLESIVYGDRKDPLAVVTRGALAALSGIYRGAIWLYLLPFEMGLRRRKRLDTPVISVGNLTVGGTGKTPMVQYLCTGLSRRGWNPAVLSYGYGGSLRGRFGIVSDRTSVLLTPHETGDEPVMLAESMPGVPVLVCKDRGKSGRAAIQDFGADVLVLDDGFQVWKLHRDLDIVLINAGKPFDNGRTLPAGRLREPSIALRRADCIIATGVWEPDARKDTLARILRAAPAAPVYFGRFKPSAVASIADGSEHPVEVLRGKRVFALSSIARPDSFEKTLADADAEIVGRERFPDHHRYSGDDIDNISRRAVETDAEYIVTTGKDAVKLHGRRFAVPAMALHGELELDDEASLWELVARKVGNSPKPSKACNVTQTR